MPKGSLIADEHGAYHFDSDAIQPPKPTAAKAGDIGSAKAAATGPAPAQDATGAANASAEATEHGPMQDVVDMVKAVPAGILPALRGMLQSLGNENIHPDAGTHILQNAQQLIHAVANPGQILSSVGSTLQNATPAQVGQNVVAPIVAGMGASRVAGAVGGTAGAAAGTPEELGVTSAENSPLLAGAAGEEGRQALIKQNATNALRVAGNQAGVPSDVPVTPQSLVDARERPGAVLDGAAASIPAGPLSPAAAQAVRAARGPATITGGSPNVEAHMARAEQSLLDPNGQFTGEDIRATRNSHNQSANAGADSTDPDVRAKAAYDRGIVSALDQHVEDSMPANGPFSVDQVKQARATLAQNYMVGDLLKGSFLDLKGLGKIHADNPNLLTGDLRTLGQFAVDHPEVSGLPSSQERFAPTGFKSGVGKAIGAEGGDVGSRLSNIFGVPTGATRLLTGNPAEMVARAAGRPVAGLGGEFEPRPGEAPGAAISPEGASAVPSAEGITATPLTQRLGDIRPKQRGAVGTPTDIGPLRQLMNNPQTYDNGPIEIPKGAAKKPEAANDQKFGPFKGNPQTIEDFLRENLGNLFR